VEFINEAKFNRTMGLNGFCRFRALKVSSKVKNMIIMNPFFKSNF
jgi:hypothetical protein